MQLLVLYPNFQYLTKYNILVLSCAQWWVFGNAEQENHSLALQTCHLLKSYFKQIQVLCRFQQNTSFMSDGKIIRLRNSQSDVISYLRKYSNTQLRYLWLPFFDHFSYLTNFLSEGYFLYLHKIICVLW